MASSPQSWRIEAGHAGGNRSAVTRRAEAEEGKAFARQWSARNRPVACTGPYPIRDHKTCAEWG